MNHVEIHPSSVTLAPGESADVTVTAIDAGAESGKVFFPVKSKHGKSKAELIVETASAVLFGEPENPMKLPITIDLIEETTTTATYRITAAPLGELSRSERRKLRRA